LIAAAHAIRPLGTRHSFSLVGDSAADGVLLSTEHLDCIVAVGEATVTVEAGIRYGELTRVLHDHGLAVANLASLPHISVGGAIATGTHGSGVKNQSLAAAVAALDLVCADGSIRSLRRGDDHVDGAVVSLGTLGLVARVTLDGRAGVRPATVRLRRSAVVRGRCTSRRDPRGRLQRQPLHDVDGARRRPRSG